MHNRTKEMTVIIPVFNESQVIRHTIDVLRQTFTSEGIPFLLLPVDDGSIDGTWAAIEELACEIPQLSGIRLSRNFGKEAAIFAGLEYAVGACAVIMDGDLQHPPVVAVEMYRLWEKGNVQIIEGVKKNRQRESTFQRICANGFYTALKLVSGVSLKNASDFKLLDRNAIDVIKRMPERRTFFRAITGWTGLPNAVVEYEVSPRAAGQTKFNRWRLIKLAVNSIASYSSLPLHVITISGLIFCIFAVIQAIQTLYKKLSGYSMDGFTTVILLQLIIGGLLMIGMGIIGLYMAKIYDEIKCRPRYIVGQTIAISSNGKNTDDNNV